MLFRSKRLERPETLRGLTVGLLDNADKIWCGLNDAAVTGTYVWTNGEPVTYTDWLTGQPDHANGIQHYATILGVLHQAAPAWTDEDGTVPRLPLIERNTDPGIGPSEGEGEGSTEGEGEGSNESGKRQNIEDFQWEDIELLGYRAHPSIKAEMAI